MELTTWFLSLKLTKLHRSFPKPKHTVFAPELNQSNVEGGLQGPQRTSLYISVLATDVKAADAAGDAKGYLCMSG